MSRFTLSAAWNRARGRVTALAAVAALAAGTGLYAGAAPAPAVHASAPSAPASVPVKGLHVVQPKNIPAPNQADQKYQPTDTQWPQAGSGSAALDAPGAGQSAGATDRIAGTPLWVQAVRDDTGSGTYQGPSRVTATVLSHAQAAALGVSAMVFDVAGDGGAQAGGVRVGLDYGSFSQAYGGNYGSRLQLVALPQCALTTPHLAQCRKQTPLDSVQDPKSSSVSAVVRLGAAAQTASVSASVSDADADATLTTAPSGGASVIGATDSTGQEGGEGGTYAAAKLKPSGTWAEGGDSGAFTYSYPITMPSASTPLVPSVSLDYNSQELDGQTATTQTQSSWLGDGWQTPDSFIALSTTPCDDDPEGTASPDATNDMCYDGEVVQMSLNGTDTPLVFVSSTTAGGVTTSTWQEQDDTGDVVTHVSDSSAVFGAYSLGADYWTVTERNGTEYEFGLQHLPGWSSGDASTDSVDTMPVYSALSGDPCYSSSGFSSSVCTMAYEWHLDYVVDTHSDATAYYYGQTTNYYGEDSGAKDVPYISDSYLSEIDYGFTAGGEYGTVPDKVVFNTSSRCVATTCGALSTSNVATQYPDVPADLMCASGTTCTEYGPSMFSQVRLSSIVTEQYSVSAGAYEDIDAYTFTQTEPASGDGLSPTLWLASISHAGDDTSTGGSSSPAPAQSVSFGAVDLQNRVSNATYPGLYRFRISSITGEMGAVTTVTYGTPDACSSSYSSSTSSAVTSANTDSCFPVYWSPASNEGKPVLDWFKSYAVTQVLVADKTGGSLTEETDYSYGGGAAWHYDDNQSVQSKYRTYGQFRGYATVTTYTGEVANNPQTESTVQYYRGMNGDTLPSGTSSISVTDSQGGTHVDYDELAGDALESTTYPGSGGPVESSTITSYWVSAAAATMNPSGLPALTANMVGPAETWTRTALTDGGEQNTWRITETDESYDATTTDADFGLLQFSYSHTDPVNTAYDSCTRDQYAPVNSAKNLVGLVSYKESDQVACKGYTAGSPTSVPGSLDSLGAPSSVTASQVSKAVEMFYDDGKFNTAFPQSAAPTVGAATMARQAVSGTPGAFTWQTESQDTYDTYGRVLDAYDADGNETVTSYTVNSVGLTTAEQVNAPSTTYTGSSGTVTTTHVSSTTLDPTRSLVLTSTDQNGVVTTAQYDSLGRPTSIWKDSRPTSESPNITYAYTESNKSVSGVVTGTLDEEGNYVPSATIYDSLGRVRQTQTLATTPTGDGRLISDTLYDSRGWTETKNTNYYDDSSEPALSLVAVASNQVPDQDDYVYDGTGRQVEDVSENDAKIVSTSVTVYDGDATTAIPDIPGSAASGTVPSRAGTVQTTVTNPLGQTTAETEYTANPALDIPSNTSTGVFYITGGTADTTDYTYDAQGKQDSTKDAAGDQWTQTYNLLGQKTQSTDPDAGTTTMSYDGDGNLLQSADAEGDHVGYTYDQLGRETAQYQWTGSSGSEQNYVSSSAPGDETDSWVYDDANGAAAQNMTDPKGQATTATAYANGFAYTTQQLGFNVFGESTGELVEIPAGAPGSSMGAEYEFSDTYEPVNGTLVKTSYPSGGGLPAETVTYSTTTALDLPSAVGGLNGYAEGTTYTAYGQVEQDVLGAGSDEAYVTDQYDPHTGNLTDRLVTRSNGSSTATPTEVDQTTYTYDTADVITSETDEQLGSAATSETQCYTYTTQQQLSEAWTATDDCAATPTTGSRPTVGDALGTASEYFESFTYNAAGERASESALAPSTGTFATTAYGYSTSQTTAPTSTSTTGAVTGSTSYAYDPDGEQDSRQTPTGNQTLAWDAAQQLTGVTNTSTGAQVGSYVYGTDGSLLSQTDGPTTTLYLPDEQISVNTTTGALTGDRYYSLPGGATAVRTGSGNDYSFEIASDQHGTNTLSLDYTCQEPTWRQYDPYGNPRGGTVAWTDDRTFLDDVDDSATGLTNVGARWYDPVTGSFVSMDPALETGDPTQLAGYDYAGNDPVSSSDPTGDMDMGGDGSGRGSNSGTPSPPDVTQYDENSDDDPNSTFQSLDPAGIVYMQEDDPDYGDLLAAYGDAAALMEQDWGTTYKTQQLQDLVTWGVACSKSMACGSGPGSLAQEVSNELDAYRITVTQAGDKEPPPPSSILTGASADPETGQKAMSLGEYIDAQGLQVQTRSTDADDISTPPWLKPVPGDDLLAQDLKTEASFSQADLGSTLSTQSQAKGIHDSPNMITTAGDGSEIVLVAAITVKGSWPAVKKVWSNVRGWFNSPNGEGNTGSPEGDDGGGDYGGSGNDEP
jgi:RHS repeat-associated protein